MADETQWPRLYMLGEDQDIPDDAVFVPLSLPSSGYFYRLGKQGYVHGREILKYLANGELDHSRSHYSVNGRKVGRSAYRRAAYGDT